MRQSENSLARFTKLETALPANASETTSIETLPAQPIKTWGEMNDSERIEQLGRSVAEISGMLNQLIAKKPDEAGATNITINAASNKAGVRSNGGSPTDRLIVAMKKRVRSRR